MAVLVPLLDVSWGEDDRCAPENRIIDLETGSNTVMLIGMVLFLAMLHLFKKFVC
jgi:hypothetical protein